MGTEATKQEMLLTIIILTNRVEELESIVAYFKRQIFGEKSEKNVPEDPDQLSLFKDDLPDVKLDVNDQETEVTVIKFQKQRKKSGEQFTGLPVIEKIYRHKTGLCPFGNPLKCIGKKMAGQKIRYFPAKLWLEKQLVENYTCDCEECFAKNGQTAFYQGELPGNLFPGSSMSPELLSNISYQKYNLGTPLYRQLKDWLANY